MLEQNRMVPAQATSVNQSAPMNSMAVSDLERQGLPRASKAFAELMGDAKSSGSEGAENLSVFASTSDSLSGNLVGLDASAESQSSHMVLSQLSVSTGNQAFQPIETTLNTENLPGLVNSTQITTAGESVLELEHSDLPELVDLNENQAQFMASGMTPAGIEPASLSTTEAVLATSLNDDEVNSIDNSLSLASKALTDPSQAPLSDAELMVSSEEVDNISVMPVFGQGQTEVTSATLGASSETKLTGISSAQAAAGAQGFSSTGNLGQSLPGNTSGQMNPQYNPQLNNSGNQAAQGGVNPTGLDAGKELSAVPKPAVESTSVKSEKNDLLASWGTNATSSTMSSSTQASFNQNSQGNSSQNPNQMMFAQMQQSQKVMEQQMATRFNEELAAARGAEATLDKEKVGGTLSDLGLAFDKRAQLPLNMQSINTPVRHPQWGQALGQRVVVMANSQIQEAKITLNPEKLGPVQIKLHVDKDQMVHVSMHAQQGTTREAMENALPRLREMLEQAGISFGSLDVGDQAQFEQNQQEQNASAEQVAENDLNDESSEEKTAILAPKTDNIVDYYA